MSQTPEEKERTREAGNLIMKLILTSPTSSDTIRECTAANGPDFTLEILREMDKNNPERGEARIWQFKRLMKAKAAGIKYANKHDKLERGREEAERKHEASRNHGYVPDFFNIYHQITNENSEYTDEQKNSGRIGLAVTHDKATVLKELDAKLAAGMDKGVYEVTKQTVESIFKYKPPAGSPMAGPVIVKPEPEFENDEDIPF